jgi:hypothetical protein
MIGIDVKLRDNSIEYLAKETCNIGITAAGLVNRECIITGIPEDVDVKKTLLSVAPSVPIEISIEYKSYPAVGFNDSSDFDVIIKNNTKKCIKGYLVFKDVPEGWVLLSYNFNITLAPESNIAIHNKIFISENVKQIRNTNILTVEFSNEKHEVVKKMKFGYAGASVWKATGAYFDPLIKGDNPEYPPAHPEGSVLPSLECMVNNAVYIDKEYIHEDFITQSILKEDFIIINSYEDLLQIDDKFTYTGQACFYLLQEIYSPEDREVWVVIGNNDGYKLWLNDELIQQNDEIRLWTPYNNSAVVIFKKGVNSLAMKLLRRTDRLKFSIGLRKHEGRHWHKNRWFTDFISIV